MRIQGLSKQQGEGNCIWMDDSGLRPAGCTQFLKQCIRMAIPEMASFSSPPRLPRGLRRLLSLVDCNKTPNTTEQLETKLRFADLRRQYSRALYYVLRYTYCNPSYSFSAPSPEPTISPYPASPVHSPAPSPDSNHLPPAPSKVPPHPRPCPHRGSGIPPSSSPTSHPNPTVPPTYAPNGSPTSPSSQFPKLNHWLRFSAGLPKTNMTLSEFDGILLDYSRQRATPETLEIGRGGGRIGLHPSKKRLTECLVESISKGYRNSKGKATAFSTAGRLYLLHILFNE
ncbi:Sugar isomerase family protein [Prunus dulcis]|uniref:Sugar isomerase family protein n=1 Tax=Prunus dulcis TaxID=3755 RepID=A0A4Y1QW98_PRUDU|nr:Sugar isomerase family protein [Prunus dulcis]